MSKNNMDTKTVDEVKVGLTDEALDNVVGGAFPPTPKKIPKKPKKPQSVIDKEQRDVVEDYPEE